MAHVFRWDLDKTYLQTDFDSVRGLVKAALQSAEEKQNIPGTGVLLRELQGRGPERNRVFVVSGSPRQMRRVLERKLLLDGVTVDSFVLKPALGNVLRFRFRAIRDQLGYKLPTLLESRARLDQEVLETCFGDDAEMDGMVYRLYGELCAGRIVGPELERIIEAARLYPDQADRIVAAASKLGARDPVQRICIHLETGSPTGRFSALGPRVAPTFNTFQTALVLHADGRLELDAVVRIVERMRTEYGYDAPRLQRSLEDAIRRRLVRVGAVESVVQGLALDLPTAPPAPVKSDAESPVDYVAMLREIHEYQRARKRSRRSRPSVRRFLGIDRD